MFYLLRITSFDVYASVQVQLIFRSVVYAQNYGAAFFFGIKQKFPEMKSKFAEARNPQMVALRVTLLSFTINVCLDKFNPIVLNVRVI